MTAEFMNAVAALDRAGAERILGAELPAWWPSEADEWLLSFRRKQINDANAEWLVRAIIRRSDGAFIGHIGFHGPPEDGIVEVGYHVFEPYRRKGYVEEALRASLDWAMEEHGIHRFRASVKPTNGPSLALVKKLASLRQACSGTSATEKNSSSNWIWSLSGRSVQAGHGDEACIAHGFVGHVF